MGGRHGWARVRTSLGGTVAGLMAMPVLASGAVVLDAPFEATAGRQATVVVRAEEPGRAPGLRRCALTVRRPAAAPGLRRGGPRTGSRSLRWRLAVPASAAPGTTYVLRVRCRGLGTASASLAVAAARARVAPGRSYAAAGGDWAHEVVNPSRRYDARDVRLQVNVAGTAGRLIDTETAYVPWLPAGGSVWVTGAVAGEAPATVTARLSAGERWPAGGQALTVADARVVRDVNEFGAVEHHVRATVGNPNGRLVEGVAATALLFAGAGRFLGHETSRPGDVVPGGRVALSEWIARPWSGRVARVVVGASGSPPGG